MGDMEIFASCIHTSQLMPFARPRYALFNAAKIIEKYYRTPEW